MVALLSLSARGYPDPSIPPPNELIPSKVDSKLFVSQQSNELDQVNTVDSAKTYLIREAPKKMVYFRTVS